MTITEQKYNEEIIDICNKINKRYKTNISNDVLVKVAIKATKTNLKIEDPNPFFYLRLFYKSEGLFEKYLSSRRRINK